uniref:FHA domain-containing protein n=1 Tax=Halobacteriovorax sp. TaxID=2020862 RepID=UPI0035615287
MKLNVSRNNITVGEFDLTSELTMAGQGLSFLIGRSNECHVCLDDKMVSREHAQLDYDGQNWKIKEISEFGKVILNGSHVVESALHNGDMITIGPFSIICFISQFNKGQLTENVPEDIEEKEEEDTAPMTETIALSSDDEIEEVSDELSDDISESDDLEPLDSLEEDAADDNESGEASAIGENTSFFSGENNDVEFPEDNDGTETFGEDVDNGDYEEEYDDYGLDDDFEDQDDKTQVLQSFASFFVELFGENAPYDRFNVDEQEVLIGRDPAKCQIVLNDPEVSSTHAKLK